MSGWPENTLRSPWKSWWKWLVKRLVLVSLLRGNLDTWISGRKRDTNFSTLVLILVPERLYETTRTTIKHTAITAQMPKFTVFDNVIQHGKMIHFSIINRIWAYPALITTATAMCYDNLLLHLLPTCWRSTKVMLGFFFFVFFA